MGESAALQTTTPAESDGQDGLGSGSSGEGGRATPATYEGRTIISVAGAGDVVLDLTFETSPETLQRTRRAALIAARKAPGGTTAAAAAQALPAVASLQRQVKVAYRTSLDALKKESAYFGNLLSSPHFSEAKIISDSHGKLASMAIKPADAAIEDLPWIAIVDDDDATKAAGREHAFEDMLRVVHQLPIKAKASTGNNGTGAGRVTMSYVATLSIIADRFDCVGAVARALNQDVKFRWPATSSRPYTDEQGRPTDTEQVVRQKVLVAWLLSQPMRLQQATRELIMRGSALWSAYHDADSDMTAAWWSLPDGLEHELQYRRECILNTIASIPRHFLHLYSSRTRQCTLGYDSSGACDTFQLGQLAKFLLAKRLLHLVDFSPLSLESLPDTTAPSDMDDLLATLKQCPSYQVDRHHVNCGPRVRVDPVLDFVRAMLSASVVSVSLADWKARRTDISWVVSKAEDRDRPAGGGGGGSGKIDHPGSGGPRVFAFTRSMANDQRLRFEGAIYADKMAKSLFTADEWDWTPEF